MKKNSILLAMLVVVLALSMALIGCGGDEEAGFVAVTDITGLPTTATVGVAFTLTGTVEPANATNKAITWYSIDDRANILADQTPNLVKTWKMRATIKDGADGKDFTKEFDLVVGPGAVAANWAAPNGATALTAATWKKETVTGYGLTDPVKDWYSFTVTKDQTYWIWWDDAWAYADTDKGEDIKVSGYYADGKVIFSEIDNGWGNTVYFKASEAGTVYLFAESIGTSFSGYATRDYSICYHTLATKPSGW